MNTSDATERPDNELIHGYLAGDISAFEQLYERYKRQLYSYLNKMLSDQYSTVDDIFQQVWIKALSKLPEYKNQDRFLGWLLRIAHNTTIDHFRRNRKWQHQVQLDSEDAPEIKDDREDLAWQRMDKAEINRALSSALEKIQPELREVFLMRQEQLSFKEIAELQGCSINTALARMQYALKNLKKYMLEWNTGGN